MLIKLKRRFPIFFILQLVLITGCSASSEEKSEKISQSNDVALDNAHSGSGEQADFYSSETGKVEKTTEPVKIKVQNQMVIYQADLELRVKKFDQAVRTLEEKVIEYGGYITESNVSKEGNEQVSGSIKIRIPQKHFQTFLHDAESQAARVLQRNITGQDVTEEYVDLESRLKSKRV
jgi:type III secretory pathway component EscV